LTGAVEVMELVIVLNLLTMDKFFTVAVLFRKSIVKESVLPILIGAKVKTATVTAINLLHNISLCGKADLFEIMNVNVSPDLTSLGLMPAMAESIASNLPHGDM